MISLGTAIVICALVAAICGLLIVLIKVTVKFITFIITNIVKGIYIGFKKIREEMRRGTSAEPPYQLQGCVERRNIERG